MDKRSASILQYLATLIISVVVIVSAYFFIFKQDTCISERNAKLIFAEAVKLESKGKPMIAYKMFKQIDLYSCNNTDISAEAFNRGARINNKIQTAYIQAEHALNKYKKNNGKYPTSLADIRNEIPQDLLLVFDEFKLKKSFDGKVWISTSNSATYTFDLH